MLNTVIIDCFPESALRYQEKYAVIAIDVIRATTTAITASTRGISCYPVPSVEAAVPLAARLDRPLLAGELGGNMPYGFDITNSPAITSQLEDLKQPMILLSSSGTQLIHQGRDCEALFIACLRNYVATAKYLIDRFQHVAVIGAGTRGEFREEDQMCCAWIAEILMEAGYIPENNSTIQLIDRWHGTSPEGCTVSKSVEYLRRTEQHKDLDFVLKHVNDVSTPFIVKREEVIPGFHADKVEKIQVESVSPTRTV